MNVFDHVTQEHQEMLPHIEQLKAAADAVGYVSPKALRPYLVEAYDFLHNQLIPHAKSEDKVLYPIVARYMGNTGATNLMSYEHAEVVVHTRRLEKLMAGPVDEPALRNVLYSLHILVLLHFNKEEEFFMPVLRSHLTTAGDEAAVQAMHRARHHAS